MPTIQNVKILLHLLKTKPVKYNSKILKEEAVLVLFACVIIPKTNNGILLPNLFWPTVRKKCSSDWENLLKLKAEGQKFANFLRWLEQFIQPVKGQNNF